MDLIYIVLIITFGLVLLIGGLPFLAMKRAKNKPMTIGACATCQAEILNPTLGCLNCRQAHKKQEIKKIGFKGIAVMACIGLFFWILNHDNAENKKHQADVDACVSRGIIYFKDMGSYPNLKSDGSNAKQVAEDRCTRATTAF